MQSKPDTNVSPQWRNRALRSLPILVHQRDVSEYHNADDSHQLIAFLYGHVANPS
jgi:hypothetical protein